MTKTKSSKTGGGKAPRGILPQPESVADFKQRIALIMRNRDGSGKVYSMVGASRAPECCVRQPGSAPTPSEVLGGAK